jgi:hypothetical protein
MTHLFGRSRSRRSLAAVSVALLAIVVVLGGLAIGGRLGPEQATGPALSPGASNSLSPSDTGLTSDSVASTGATLTPDSTNIVAVGTPVITAASASAATGPTATLAAPTTAPAAPATAAPTHAPTPTATPALPDLTFGLTNTALLRCGVRFHLTTYIYNAGSGGVTGSIAVQVTDSYSGHQTISARTSVSALAAGEYQLASFDVSTDEGCGLTHTMTLRIDPDNSIVEVSKLNNVKTMSYVMQPMPDLSDTWLAVNHDPACGVEFTATTIVHNQGGATTSRAGVVRFVDSWNGTEQKSTIQSFPILASGASFTAHVTMIVTTHCGAVHTLTATVDSDASITESHEDNNTRSITYTM